MRAVLIAVSCALALPPVCFAHGGGSKHGYVSTVERIVDANGIDAAASGDGHFSFTAPAGKTVIVHGYSNEPYVRFHGGSIAVNDLAPTTYVNDDKPPRRAQTRKQRPSGARSTTGSPTSGATTAPTGWRRSRRPRYARSRRRPTTSRTGR